MTARCKTCGHEIESNSLVFDFDNGSLFVDGAQIKLTPTEAVILKVLLDAKGGTVSRSKLVRALWGYAAPDNAMNTMCSHICKLRKTKLVGTRVELKSRYSFGYWVEVRPGK